MSVLRALAWFGGAILTLTALNVALRLVSAPSTLAVLGGVWLLAVVAIVVFFAGRKVYRDTRSWWAAFSVVLLLPALSGCAQRVEPGHVGLKVNLYGGNRGVDSIPLVTGMVWYNPFSTTVYEYPTFVQTAVWTRNPHEGNNPNTPDGTNEEITFNSKEGLIISADISLSYQLAAEKAPHFYVQFRSDDINHFTHGFLRNVARDAFNEEAATYTVEELYATRKEEFLTKVRSRVNQQVGPYGIQIDQLGFIGAPRLPTNVMDALNGKIQAIQDAQRAQNRVQQAQAEAQIAVAKARGEAESNRILTLSLTSQLLQWRSLEIQQQAIGRWNGTLPTYTGNQLPFLQIAPTQR